MTQVRWIAVEDDTIQEAGLERTDDGWRLETLVRENAGDVRILILTDREWRTRRLCVETPDWGRLDLLGDGLGGWTDSRGRRVEAITGAVDPDVSTTPLTNTLPIRRLNLAVGESADIVAAYVDGATLDLFADPQRYNRLAERRWLYKSRDSDFRREIKVDENGLVIDYPGLFRRLRITAP